MTEKANQRIIGAPPATPTMTTTKAKAATSTSSADAKNTKTTATNKTTTATTNKKRKRRTRTPGRAGQPLSAYNIFFRYERARIIELNSQRRQQQQQRQKLSSDADASGAIASVIVSDSDSDDERNNQQKRSPQPPQQQHPPAEEQKPPRQPITEQTLRTFLSQNPYQTPRNRKKRLHRRTHGAVSFTELNTIVSRNWKSLDEASKRAFLDVAAELRVEHYRRLEEEVRREMMAAEEQEQAQQTQMQTQTQMTDSAIGAPTTKKKEISPILASKEANDAQQRRGDGNDNPKKKARTQKKAPSNMTGSKNKTNREQQRAKDDSEKKTLTHRQKKEVPSKAVSPPKEADDVPKKNVSSAKAVISFPRRVSVELPTPASAEKERNARKEESINGSKKPFNVPLKKDKSDGTTLRTLGKNQKAVVATKERRVASPKSGNDPLSISSASDATAARTMGKKQKEASSLPTHVSRPSCTSTEAKAESVAVAMERNTLRRSAPSHPTLPSPTKYLLAATSDGSLVTKRRRLLKEESAVADAKEGNEFHQWNKDVQRQRWNDLKKRKAPSVVTPSPSPRGCISTPTTSMMHEPTAANLSKLSTPMLDEPPPPSKRPRLQRETAPTAARYAATNNHAVVEPIIVPSVEPVVAPSVGHPSPSPRCLLTELLEESLAAISPVGPTVVPSSDGKVAPGYDNGAAIGNGGVDDSSCEEGFVSVLDLEFAGLWLLNNPSGPRGANHVGAYAPQSHSCEEEGNHFTAAQSNCMEFSRGTMNPVPSSSPPSSSFLSSLPSLSKPSEDEANFMGELLELAS